jgi:flagellin-like hook-associated protein FlgL
LNIVVLQAGDNAGQELSLPLGSVYRTVWSTNNNWTGRTLTSGNDNRYQSYGYAIDFTDATGPVNLGDFDPSVHSSFKFTVIDAVGNEVPVLLRITNAIREAVLTGPPLTLTTNDPEVAGIGGGRDSLFSVLSGAGHTGIRVRFGTNNSGNPATNSVQIWSPTQNQYFSVKNNQLDLLTGDIADVDIVGLESKAASEAAIGKLDAAITNILSTRARYGSFIGRLEHAQDNLMNVAQNTDASRSRIEDADYAAETSELARTQIISQASTAMLAQANQSKQSVLALLQG